MDTVAHKQKRSWPLNQMNVTTLVYYRRWTLPLYRTSLQYMDKSADERYRYRILQHIDTTANGRYRYRTLEHMDTTARGRYCYRTLHHPTLPRQTSIFGQFRFFITFCIQFVPISIMARRPLNE